MRVALLLMLFQFFAPSFFPVVIQEAPHAKASYLQVPHGSIAIPFLLKENDEKEYEENSSVPNLAIIIDFADHSTNLTATHKRKSNYSHKDQWYDPQPALFTRHCTFLI
jgi:hypothetical protein